MKKVLKRSSKDPKKALDKTVSNRILILACLIVGLFGVLFLRLVYLQVISHEEYVEKQDDYTSIKQYTAAPRGQIYDVNGKVLAKTVVSHNIVYTSPNNLTVEDYLMYANRAATVFDIDLEDFSSRELMEAYLTYCSFVDSDDPVYGGYYLLSEKDQEAYWNGDWGSNASTRLYAKQIAALSEMESLPLEDDQILIYAVYNRMMSNSSTGQEATILEDVSDTDVAYLVEHKTEFPGFDVDFGGWKREYPYGESLSDVLGTVSTSTEGLPESSSDYYLSKGYQYNAQVGKSGLEYEYNDLLAGTEEIAKITYDSNGLAHKEIIQEAKKGYDIYLSIDIELQQVLDETVKTVLQEKGGTANRENFSSLFMCMMNPNTGDVIALSGYQKDLETGQMTYFASGNYLSLINPGSCVKGATVFMGLNEGVIASGEVINDTVMTIAGQQFASFSNKGLVNDIQALSVSSNVYMFHIALRLAGTTYTEGMSLNLSDTAGTLDLMRNYYSMFGLGNPTGLDVPSEVSAYMGTSTASETVLNYAIGQYDMYSPMQMLQYVSVIAADGKMYQPKLYSYSKEVNGDQIFDVNDSTLKSTLPEGTEEYLDDVQEGFRACVADGNCYAALETLEYNMAAKTGTAEVNEWTTANLIGYGPYEDPTIAFACSAPTSSVNSSSVSANVCAESVVGPVLEKYFELYPQ